MYKTAAIGALLIAAAGVVGPAQAQYGPYYGYPSYAPYRQRMDAVPPHRVMSVVRSLNMMPVGRPIWTGNTYVVRAMDRRGEMVRIVLSGRSGDVLSMAPLGPAYGHYPYRFGYRDAAPRYEDAPVPPESIPEGYVGRRAAPEGYGGRPPFPDLMTPPPGATQRPYPEIGMVPPPAERPRATVPTSPPQAKRTTTAARTPLPRPRPAAANQASVKPAAAPAPAVASAPPVYSTASAPPAAAAASQADAPAVTGSVPVASAPAAGIAPKTPAAQGFPPVVTLE